MSFNENSTATIETNKLKSTILCLEEAAAKKDKHISQLTSRMREYEMGEYGLSEAVTEIKECRKVIRVRDKEIENLTDEINSLKLQMTSHIEYTKDHIVKLEELSSTEEDSFTNQTEKQARKPCQCHFPVLSTQHAEDIYSIQFQNMKLRIELNSMCQRAFDLLAQLQTFCKQDLEKQDKISQIQEELVNISKTTITRKFKSNKYSWEDFRISQNLNTDDCTYEACKLSQLTNSKELQETIINLLQQITVLKNNQTLLIRRYKILSDRESSLRKENLTLKKTLPRNWKDHVKIPDIIGQKVHQVTTNFLSSDDCNFLKKVREKSQTSCKTFCQENAVKLLNITLKLLDELPLIKKLLQISHYQTQAVEAMWFAQEIEIKALREHLTILQAQSDEKMLLGKLALKLLQLQFNQAACVYELKKCKSNEQNLQNWYSVLQTEYEENGRRFTSLYLEAVKKAQHLHHLLKDLSQQCNKALASYLSA